MNAHSGTFDRAGIIGVSLLDRFAEALAETDSVAEASRIVRVSVEQGEALFKRICQRLGDQAA